MASRAATTERAATGRHVPGRRTGRARIRRRRRPDDRPAPRGVPRISGRTVVWLAVYALGLAACHYLVIAPAFAYLGFEKVPPNPLVAIAVTPTYLLCARRLPLSWERPSAIVYWMLFLVVVAPVHVLPMFTTNLSTAVWLMVAAVAAAFWLLGGIYSVPLWTFRPPAVPARVYWPAYAMVWLVMTGVVVGYYGLHLRLVSLSEIYAVRDTYRDSFGEVPKVATYVVPWLGNVIAPVAIARGLMTRRWSWVALGVLTELYLVSITGFKQLLLSSLLAAGVVVLARTTNLARTGWRVGVLAGCGVFAITLLDFVRGSWGMSSILVRRMVLTSAINTKYHFEFFLQNPKGHLGYGVLSHWVHYPYDLKPPFLIGQVFYGNPEMSANANLWADATPTSGWWRSCHRHPRPGAALRRQRRPRPAGRPGPGRPRPVGVQRVQHRDVDGLPHPRHVAGGDGRLLHAGRRRRRRPGEASRRPAASASPRARGAPDPPGPARGGAAAPTRTSTPFRKPGISRAETSAGRGGCWAQPVRSPTVTGRRHPARGAVRPPFAVVPPHRGRQPQLHHPGTLLQPVAGVRDRSRSELRVQRPRPGAELADVRGGCAGRGTAVGPLRRRVRVVAAAAHPAGRLALARLRRVPLVVEIRDLWPRSMVELGYLSDGSRTHRMLVALEGFVYRSADVIVAVADGWQDHFAAFGVRPEKVVLVSNGAATRRLLPTVSREEKARAELGADGFVAVYAGAQARPTAWTWCWTRPESCPAARSS